MSTNHALFQATSFIGRQEELTHLADLMADKDCRLLTIVGPGGIGKTRLALEAAHQQEPYFKDGVFDVALAPVVSSDLVVATIADRLSFTFRGQDRPHIQLSQYLQDKQILLVLDNFEHLIEESMLLSHLLRAAPALKLLVTSRERLNLQEEWTVVLEGLAYPEDGSLEGLESFSAVRLFVQRARQVHTKFSLQDHMDAVAAICRQVEGMPLGLELAASWLRVMSCEQIAEQVGHDLDFLTTPVRNVPERHRSLRRVFEQSWQMLAADEQAVLMRLSVFRGGFNLESSEYVAGATLNVLASLVDKSLVRVSNEGRYDLHELLRQYAAEKLAQAGEEETTRQRHLEYFIAFAEEAERHLFGSQQMAWFDRLEAEMDNFRTAFNYAAESEAGLQLAVSLGWFFSECSYWNEGLNWFERALRANPNIAAEIHVKALHLVTGLAGHFGDQARLFMYGQQAIELGKAIDNKKAVAWALAHLGQYRDTNIPEAGYQLQESLALFRQIGDVMGITHCLVRLSWNAITQGDLTLARACVEEAAELCKQADDTIMMAWVATTFGNMARTQHHFAEASEHFKRAAAMFHQVRLFDGVNVVLTNLANCEVNLKHWEAAQRIYIEALRLPRGAMINHPCLPVSFAGLGHIARVRGQYERSACLLGAAYVDWLIEDSKNDLKLQPYEHDIDFVRSHMGEDAFEAAWAVGKAMTTREAEKYALEGEFLEEQSPITKQNNWRVEAEVEQISKLTARELEILRLLSDGLNSREIADRLYLSAKTVRWYLKIIYNKLDVHSRSEAIARAKELKLIV